MDIDIDAIRRDLKDKYGTAMYNGFHARHMNDGITAIAMAI